MVHIRPVNNPLRKLKRSPPPPKSTALALAPLSKAGNTVQHSTYLRKVFKNS